MIKKGESTMDDLIVCAAKLAGIIACVTIPVTVIQVVAFMVLDKLTDGKEFDSLLKISTSEVKFRLKARSNN